MKFSFKNPFRRGKDIQHSDPMASIGRFRLRCRACGNTFRSTWRLERFCKSCSVESFETLQEIFTNRAREAGWAR